MSTIATSALMPMTIHRVSWAAGCPYGASSTRAEGPRARRAVARTAPARARPRRSVRSIGFRPRIGPNRSPRDPDTNRALRHQPRTDLAHRRCESRPRPHRQPERRLDGRRYWRPRRSRRGAPRTGRARRDPARASTAPRLTRWRSFIAVCASATVSPAGSRATTSMLSPTITSPGCRTAEVPAGAPGRAHPRPGYPRAGGTTRA